jgi:hypothetical protein
MRHAQLLLVVIVGLFVGSAVVPPPSASAQQDVCTSRQCCDDAVRAAGGFLSQHDADSVRQLCDAPGTSEAQRGEIVTMLGGWTQALGRNTPAREAAAAAAAR